MRGKLSKVWKAFGFLRAANSANKETIPKAENNDDCGANAAAAAAAATATDLSDERFNSWMVRFDLYAMINNWGIFVIYEMGSGGTPISHNLL